MELLPDQQLCLRTFQTIYTKLSKVVVRPQTLQTEGQRQNEKLLVCVVIYCLSQSSKF